MNQFCGPSSVFTRFLTVIAVLVFRERALGLINNRPSSNSKPRYCSARGSTSLQQTTVDVWNNVIDIDHLAPVLHEESHRIGLGHQVFSRSSLKASPKNITHNNNIIEKTLDSILTELGDDSRYVEYWTRREWRSIHAHADVDEYKAKQDQQSGETIDTGFRYPRNGHVLYLQVGSEVRGPTCVFPNRRSGGDLLRRIETPGEGDDSCENSDFHSKDEQDDTVGVAETEEDDDVEVITVPAVPGRLLRFQGDFLHAVPRPTDFWLLKFVQGSPTFEPEEEWGRSVILFNTWDEEPPAGLPINESSNDESDDSSNELRCECNKINEWSRAGPSSLLPAEGHDEIQQQARSQAAKIWILGDHRRRDHRMQTVKLEASEELRDALYQKTDVVSMKLRIPV